MELKHLPILRQIILFKTTTNDVIATVKDSCEVNNIQHPIIISESGRAIISHCSVLIFNILGTSHVNSQVKVSDNKEQSLIITNLIETLNQLKSLRDKKKIYLK